MAHSDRLSDDVSHCQPVDVIGLLADKYHESAVNLSHPGHNGYNTALVTHDEYHESGTLLPSSCNTDLVAYRRIWHVIAVILALRQTNA